VTDAAGVPVVGVVDPGVRAAVRATHNGRIGMIGTEATVKSGAYDRAVLRTDRDVQLFSRACPVFVEYVERGDTTSPELFAAARDYLASLQTADVDTLILGCTHYPMLSGLIGQIMGRDVVLISSADETARDVYAALAAGDLRSSVSTAVHEFVCTGDPGSFRAVAEHFLGPSIPDVRLVVPGGFRASVGG
jgi:glutamate racemase